MASTTPDRELLKLATLESTYFAEYHKQVATNRRMYECTWTEQATISGAESYMTYIPPTAARAIDDPADHILHMPKTRVPVRSQTDNQMEAQHSAEKKRKFLAGWWSRVVEDSNPIGDSVVAALNEGRFVWRREFDFDDIPDKPAEGAPRNERRRYRKAMADLGKDEFLWKVEVLDNCTVFEDPRSHRDPGYVYLKFDISAEEARDLWPSHASDWDDLEDYSMLEYVEYWSKPEGGKPGRCMKWVQSEKVWDEESPYPYIPIVIEDSGQGTNRRGATPKQKYVGMTEKLFSTFIAEARQMTAWEISNELSAFPMVKAWNMQKDRRLAVGPGIVTDLTRTGKEDGEDVEYMQMPPIPVGVLQLVQKTTQIANSLTKMDTLSGQPVAGVETASEASQQINNAAAKLTRLVSAYQRAAQRMNRMTLMDVELVAEGPITIYGTAGEYGETTLEPSDINGFYENSVELRTTDADMTSQIKARFWGEMYRLIPFLSAWTAMERGEIADDPTMEMMRRASEDVFLSPEMTMIRTLTGANSFGEFATLVKGNGWQSGNTGNGQQPAGPDSTEGLLSQESLTSPLEASTVDTAINNRDITQRVNQIRAPKEVKRAYSG